ncbi:MAG: DNA recombination/repair protein RecA, partial [Candidatus Latescibacteria bacterium]|nr:DNA recombination/repair protein RecA [Candidatus Latescibacterota bacterium]
IIDAALDMGILEKAGAWYSYGQERLGQGRENVRIFLKENPDIRDQLEAKVREEFGLVGLEPSDQEHTEADVSAKPGAQE